MAAMGMLTEKDINRGGTALRALEKHIPEAKILSAPQKAYLKSFCGHHIDDFLHAVAAKLEAERLSAHLETLMKSARHTVPKDAISGEIVIGTQTRAFVTIRHNDDGIHGDLQKNLGKIKAPEGKEHQIIRIPNGNTRVNVVPAGFVNSN